MSSPPSSRCSRTPAAATRCSPWGARPRRCSAARRATSCAVRPHEGRRHRRLRDHRGDAPLLHRARAQPAHAGEAAHHHLRPVRHHRGREARGARAPRAAGAREVYLIEEPMAAAIGAGLPITEPSGNMIVDIGGGTTEVAVISLAGIVYSQSVRVGGDKMDEAIMQLHEAQVQPARSASRPPSSSRSDRQRLSRPRRSDHGGQGPRPRGRRPEDRRRQLRRESARRSPSRSTPSSRPCSSPSSGPRPELAADIVDKGIVLTGGGALLRNLDVLFREETGLPGDARRRPTDCSGPRYRGAASTNSACSRR